jgi:nitrilase
LVDEDIKGSFQIDLDDIIGAKLDFDPVGHYAREEVVMEALLGVRKP